MKILPCPFCGGTDVGVATGHEPGIQIDAQVECYHCCANGPMYTCLIDNDGLFENTAEELEEQAITQWNGAIR